MDPINSQRDYSRKPIDDKPAGKTSSERTAHKPLDHQSIPLDRAKELRTLQFVNATAERKVDAPATPPASTPAKGLFTTNKNEVVTTRTTPTPQDVMAAVHDKWPKLSEQGQRILAAQFMGETGNGANCYNWNLGNAKEPDASKPHMYLRGVWEALPTEKGKALVEGGEGLVRYVGADEAKKRGMSCREGQTLVGFDPPHSAARFRAYDSLAQAAGSWLAIHQRVMDRDPSYAQALEGGDVAAAAHSLKMAGYYTAPEESYARLMTAKKADVDRLLAPKDLSKGDMKHAAEKPQGAANPAKGPVKLDQVGNLNRAKGAENQSLQALMKTLRTVNPREAIRLDQGLKAAPAKNPENQSLQALMKTLRTVNPQEPIRLDQGVKPDLSGADEKRAPEAVSKGAGAANGAQGPTKPAQGGEKPSQHAANSAQGRVKLDQAQKSDPLREAVERGVEALKSGKGHGKAAEGHPKQSHAHVGHHVRRHVEHDVEGH